MKTARAQGGHAIALDPEPAGPRPGARASLKSMLAGLPLDDQMAMLRPPPAARSAAADAPVQKLDAADNRPAITKLDAANLAQVVEALRKDGVWPTLVSNAQAVTQQGAVPLTSAAEDELLLQALIAVEARFQFAEGVSLDDMLTHAGTRQAIIGAIKTDAFPKVAVPAAGTFGMVTHDTELTLPDGSKVALEAGDALESLGEVDGQMKAKVHSGKNLEGTLTPAVFKAQPRIATDDKTGDTESHTYQEYVGQLFLGEPSVSDVDQGALGDCFLIAGMGAVVAASPELIKKAVVYNGDKTYTVTFQELQRDGTFKPHAEVVDAYLPTRQGSGPNRTAYAQSDKAFDPADQALWPAIVEKAYAQWKGGYTAIQSGGQSAKAMEALTGVRSVRAAMPDEDDVITTFKAWQDDNKAVVCGTHDWVEQSKQTGLLGGAGAGPYTGTLKDKQGNPAEIVKGTVSIKDSGGKAGTARDDRKGKLTGSQIDSGEIEYESGAVELTYKEGKGPDSADTLEASYHFEGLLDAALNVHGDHAYIFSRVEGQTLVFHNPWGPAAHKHPKPLSAADFRRLFGTLAVNATVPQQED